LASELVYSPNLLFAWYAQKYASALAPRDITPT